MLVSKQFHEANNMTDALAALAAVAAQLPCRDALMQEYDDKWHQNGLVMINGLSASHQPGGEFETVRGLLQAAFTMSNPKLIVRRLACGATAAFHAKMAWLPVPGECYRPQQP